MKTLMLTIATLLATVAAHASSAKIEMTDYKETFTQVEEASDSVRFQLTKTEGEAELLGQHQEINGPSEDDVSFITIRKVDEKRIAIRIEASGFGLKLDKTYDAVFTKGSWSEFKAGQKVKMDTTSAAVEQMHKDALVFSNDVFLKELGMGVSKISYVGEGSMKGNIREISQKTDKITYELKY